MRFTRNIDGLSRISDHEKRYRHKYNDKGWYYDPLKKSEPSEDTKTRKNINETIVKMIKEGKNDIQIEIYLKNMYPTYSEYILKMISHQFSKIKSSDSKDGKNGEAR